MTSTKVVISIILISKLTCALHVSSVERHVASPTSSSSGASSTTIVSASTSTIVTPTSSIIWRYILMTGDCLEIVELVILLIFFSWSGRSCFELRAVPYVMSRSWTDITNITWMQFFLVVITWTFLPKQSTSSTTTFLMLKVRISSSLISPSTPWAPRTPSQIWVVFPILLMLTLLLKVVGVRLIIRLMIIVVLLILLLLCVVVVSSLFVRHCSHHLIVIFIILLWVNFELSILGIMSLLVSYFLVL